MVLPISKLLPFSTPSDNVHEAENDKRMSASNNRND